MKKFLSIVLFFISLQSIGQIIKQKQVEWLSDSLNRPTKPTVYNNGIVAFYDDFKRDYLGSDYTAAFPATTATISSDGLNLIGTPFNYNNYVARSSFYTAA